MDNRIREMDGLRGVAIVLVMALHIFNRANEFTRHPVLYFFSDLTVLGWIGVDIFFVLSGFLITTILLKTREQEFYFRNFYMRRILRIVPLYSLTMLVVFLIIIPLKTPAFVEHIPALLPYQFLQLQNWLSIESLNKTSPYIWVTWSLAIEEQFYLFWPALVYLKKKEGLIRFGIAYVIISAIIRAIGILVWDDLSLASHFFYYNSFSRFDELIFGGLLAIVLTIDTWRHRITSLALPVLFISSIIFVILCIVDLPNLPHPNFRHIPLNIAGYTTLSISTVALIAIFVTHPEKSALRRIFRNKVLTFLGDYSYGMYLFHMPITLILLDLFWWTHLRGWKMFVLYILASYLVTILISYISWHVLEKHALGLKKYFKMDNSGSANIGQVNRTPPRVE